MRPISSLPALALSLLVAACGDEATSDADAAPDAPDSGIPGCTCLALGVDYVAGVGGLGAVHLPELGVEQSLVAQGTVSSDPVARLIDGDLYVINRFNADNVTIVDATTHEVQDQFSIGKGANPQDVALVDGRLWVVSFGVAEIRIYDPADTSAPEDIIDISEYDEDGNPNATSILAANGQIFVSLGVLDADTFLPSGPGRILVIDPATREIVDDTLTLRFENPSGFLRADGGRILISTAADYSGTSGCVETIDPAVPEVGDCIVENVDLGGVPNGLIRAENGDLYVAVVTTTPGEGTIRRVAADGSVDATPRTPEAQDATDLAYCAATDQIVYADQSSGALRVYGVAAGAEVTTAPLDIGLPAAFGSGLVCF